MTNSTAGRPARRTPWSADAAAPVRTFLRTESGSAGVLLLAIVVALVWANVDSRFVRTAVEHRLLRAPRRLRHHA